MVDEDNFLVPVRKSEIEVGKPLAFAVYDTCRNLLLNQGVVVSSENQLQVLLEKGLYRESGTHKPGHPFPDSTSATRDGKSDRAKEETMSFEAMKLAPGDILQLQPLLEGQTERYAVRMIGAMKSRSVLVTTPMVDGKLIFIRDGQTFLARAFSGLNVCAFRVKVLKSQLQPFPYLHLSYPDVVQAMRIRRSMRAPCDIIVAVHETEEGRQVGAGRMIDISVGGARVLSPTKLGRKGTDIWISFKVRIGDMEEYVKTPVVICRLDMEEEDQGQPVNAHGVQFGHLTQPQRLIIMNLVYQHLLKEND